MHNNQLYAHTGTPRYWRNYLRVDICSFPLKFLFPAHHEHMKTTCQSFGLFFLVCCPGIGPIVSNVRCTIIVFSLWDHSVMTKWYKDSKNSRLPWPVDRKNNRRSKAVGFSLSQSIIFQLAHKHQWPMADVGNIMDLLFFTSDIITRHIGVKNVIHRFLIDTDGVEKNPCPQ